MILGGFAVCWVNVSSGRCLAYQRVYLQCYVDLHVLSVDLLPLFDLDLAPCCPSALSPSHAGSGLLLRVVFVCYWYSCSCPSALRRLTLQRRRRHAQMESLGSSLSSVFSDLASYCFERQSCGML